MMPGTHLKESFGESQNPHVYERLDMIADHYHFDTKGNWTDSRDGKANELGEDTPTSVRPFAYRETGPNCIETN